MADKVESSAAVVAAKALRKVQPLEALNPYTSAWTVRVRASGKGALRTVKTSRGDAKVFSVELTDEQGVTCQATAWKEAAEKLFATFEDNKVYYVSNGQLKPADRRYSSSSFVYEMSLGDNSVVELCTDTEMVAAALRYEFVPFDALPTKLGSKATVDVLAVVTQVGELGSVARKSDGVTIQKRDITLLDATQRTCKLTLWNSLAEVEGAQLAALSNPVIALKGVRLSDYNGLSMSTIGRSALALEPQSPQADALRAWHAKEGATCTTVEVGAGLAGAKGAGGGKASRRSLAEVSSEAVPSPDAKPEWCTLYGCVIFIAPDSAMYYPACPQEGCNKKVVEDGTGGWRCEACNTSSGACKRRFILRFKAADATAATWVNCFDDQARLMFGCSADELHAEKEADAALFARRLKEVQWRPWLIKAKLVSEVYNNETRRRITAVSLSKPDYSQLSKELLDEMCGRAAAVKAE